MPPGTQYAVNRVLQAVKGKQTLVTFVCYRWPRFRSAMSGFVRMAIDRYVNLVDSISGKCSIIHV
jgi:hypothetical protein